MAGVAASFGPGDRLFGLNAPVRTLERAQVPFIH
jgi:hypothetical protein